MRHLQAGHTAAPVCPGAEGPPSSMAMHLVPKQLETIPKIIIRVHLVPSPRCLGSPATASSHHTQAPRVPAQAGAHAAQETVLRPAEWPVRGTQQQDAAADTDAFRHIGARRMLEEMETQTQMHTQTQTNTNTQTHRHTRTDMQTDIGHRHRPWRRGSRAGRGRAAGHCMDRTM